MDVLIIGAGLSGLMAAQRLAQAGLSVTVIERESAPGGRLATWGSGSARADTGAQFFTVRTAEFAAVVARWLAEGWVFEWSRGWSGGTSAEDRPDGYPRYVARDGFAALARRLSADLPIRYDLELTGLAAGAEGWAVATGDGRRIDGRALILTPPVPLSLAFLDAAGIAIPADQRKTLDAIRYGSCLCGVFEVEGEVALPPPGALYRPGHSISWVGDNQRKGLSARRILTVHANPAASAEQWAETDEAVLAWMAAELSPWLVAGARLEQTALKRWPYAVPLSTYPARCLALPAAAPLLLAGDAFDGPRVEGAALSGLATADALLKILGVSD